LRERGEDIPALAQYFLARFAAEENKTVIGFTPEALSMLTGYSWPGNVRQLENTIFRAVVLCDSDRLDVVDFPQIASAMNVNPRERLAGVPHASASVAPSASGGLVHSLPAGLSPYAIGAADAAGHIRKLEELEREIIRMAIERYHGRMSEVARRLGIGRSTLYRKLKDLGLENEAAADDAIQSERAAAG
jgi:DNA-binding NtrC family response regulator